MPERMRFLERANTTDSNALDTFLYVRQRKECERINALFGMNIIKDRKVRHTMITMDFLWL